MIVAPQQAEAIIASGQADQVALARAFLDDPRWVWHAAETQGIRIPYPHQYERCRAEEWPGSKLGRLLASHSTGFEPV
jgi:2,4-dienoyl-CoA reductase-like NADH-dependent reductase (Old Yellow Enzyme family)